MLLRTIQPVSRPRAGRAHHRPSDRVGFLREPSLSIADGLSRVPLPQLERLSLAIASGEIPVPIQRTGFEAKGLADCWDQARWLSHLDREGLLAVLAATIAERRQRSNSPIELVWTGPEARVSPARDTAVVLRQLFSRTRRHVIVAGFSFTGATILEPLAQAMAERPIDVTFFLHIDDVPGLSAEDAAREGVDRFLTENWPSGTPRPRIYYDPRTVTAGSTINLHAKCVVVDARWALVGSANFTHNAHARNIELGALIDDEPFAASLVRQWQGLIDSGLVTAALFA